MEAVDSNVVPELVAACRRRRKVLFGVAVPLPLAALLLAGAVPSTYRSMASFSIEESRLPGLSQSATGQRDTYADQYVKDLAETIRRPDSLSRMLLTTGEMGTAAAIGEKDKAIAAADKGIDVQIVSKQVLDPQSGRERTIISSFSISADARTPATAQARTTWLADAFVNADRQSRLQRAAATSKFLDDDVERLHMKLEEKEKLLADFKQRNIGSLPEINQLNLDMKNRAENDLQSSETQLRSLVRDRDFAQQQLQQSKSQSPSAERLQQLEEDYQRKAQIYDDAHPDMLALRREIDELRAGGAQGGTTLAGQLAAQQAALKQARTRYQEDHPDVKRLERTVATLQARVAAGETETATARALTPTQLQFTTTVNSLNSQIASLQASIASSRSRISSMQSQITATPQVERQYAVLNQDVSAARQGYQESLQHKIEADSAQQAIVSGSADAFRMIQRPSLPSATVKSRKYLLVLAGLALGVIAGISAIVLAELRDSTVRSSRDVLKVLGVTPLGMIPVIASARSRLAVVQGRLKLAGTVIAATVVVFFAGYTLLVS